MVHHKAIVAFTWVASLLKIGIALAIIIIIAVHLNNQTVWMSNSAGQSVQVQWTCLLGWGTYRAASLCIYGYVVAGWSLIFSAFLSVLMIASCGVFGPDLMCEFAMSVFGLFWWIIAGAVFTHYSQSADGIGMPNNNWRHSIYAMSWVMTGIYLVLCIVYPLAGRAATKREAAANAANKGGQQTVGVMVAAPAVVVMPTKAEDGTASIAYAT